MKKYLLGTLAIAVLCVTFAFPAFGEKSLLNSENVSASNRVAKEPRGSIISTGSLRISNEGNGEIGVLMQTMAHVDIDETLFFVSLDRWIESEKRWANVANFDFSYKQEDYPDENISVKSISFNILGQPVDCYYRLRGNHIVVLGDKRESLSSETDGILITK